MRGIIEVVKQTLTNCSKNRVGTMAAALAYFTFFSIAPVVIVAIAVAGLVFGQEAAQGAITGYLQDLIGQASAQTVQDLVKHASRAKASGIVATISGVVAICYGATGVFAELQSSLNAVWEAPALKINRVAAFFRTRFLSLSVVLGVGFLLLVSLMVSVALSAVCEWIGYCDELIGRVVEWAVSFGVAAVLFGLIFKVLPDVKAAWRHVWHGALLTAVFFTIGKTILSFVLSKTPILSAYGTAASLAALLLWVQYSSLILLVGAEMSHVIALRSEPHKPEVDAPWAQGAPAH